LTNCAGYDKLPFHERHKMKNRTSVRGGGAAAADDDDVK
jgi:hypothetical protein